MEEAYEGGMTDGQLASYLLTLANLIEATAKTAGDAAAILREQAEFLRRFPRSAETDGGREESMTAAEAARLSDWLTANGHTAQEAADCIRFLAADA